MRCDGVGRHTVAVMRCVVGVALHTAVSVKSGRFVGEGLHTVVCGVVMRFDHHSIFFHIVVW